MLRTFLIIAGIASSFLLQGCAQTSWVADIEKNTEIIFDIVKKDKKEKLIINVYKGEIFVVNKDKKQMGRFEFVTPLCKVIPYGTIF